MFGIRADMNDTIGLGHVMRCLSVADALRCLGEEVLFITADEKGSRLFSERKIHFISLDSDWKNPEAELAKLKKVIADRKIHHLIVDKYEITQEYMSRLCECTELTYIDDLASQVWPCHNLIMYANYYQKFSIWNSYCNTRLLLGTSYTPLRAEYQNIPPKNISSDVRKVLFLSGGTDEYRLAITFLQELGKRELYEQLEVCVICGPYCKSLEELKLFARERGRDRVKICVQVHDMWNYMMWADIAVSAGGTSLYELSACGTPFITYLIAENQRDNVETFARECQIPYMGDMRTDPARKMAELTDSLLELIYSQSKRAEMSMHLKECVDGEGAARLAKELVK